jgi:DegV family protein with EDD domain
MPKTCILTDTTAQFPAPAFAGRDLVHVIPLHIEIDGEIHPKGEDLRATDLPANTRNGRVPNALAPSVEDFSAMLAYLDQHYEEIAVILHTSKLTKTVQHAEQAVAAAQIQAKIQVIDSETTSIGLGLLVQAASAAAEQGASAAQIDDLIRKLIPRVYSVFCVEGLSYLEKRGDLNAAQSLIGEHLKMLPLFILDNGALAPTLKARNLRHLVDLLQEFLMEFTELEHIAILQGAPAFEAETRALRERIAEDFDGVPLSEHTISAPLASILGPRSLGLFVMQPETPAGL